MRHYYSLLSKIYNDGDLVEARGLKTKEILGAGLEVKDYNCFASPCHRPWEDVKKYLYAELCWYLSGERSIEKILPYSKFWGQIRNPDNTANSNYGDLVFYRKNEHGVTSFDWALRQLKDDKFTRKAIVLYNDRNFFFYENKDLICNQFQHFMIRNDELICFVSLRSSDAIYGLTYNIPWWSLVHQQMLHKLKDNYPSLKLGRIEAFIDSSHIYENKWELTRNILLDEKIKIWASFSEIPLAKTFEWYYENLHNFVSFSEVN